MNDPPAPTPAGSPDRPVRRAGLYGLSWVSASELDFLIALLPPRGLYVEVGTASGVTAAVVADARPGLDVLCVDSYPDHDAPHVAGAEPCRVDHWRRNAAGRPNMTLWLGTLAGLARLCPGLRADAVLVDGDHAEAAVAADLLAAAGMLAAGGTLFAHDCGEPDYPWVEAAAERFCAEQGFAVVGRHWTMRAMRR